MDRFDRFYLLHKALSNARRPVSGKDLQDRLECSSPTLKRIIIAMRDYLGAPILYDRRRNGYHYNTGAEYSYELPGLWFNASELHALMTTQHLLAHLQPGLLAEHIDPLRKRIDALLTVQGEGAGEELEHRVRILGIAARTPDNEIFRQIASALLRRKKIRIDYHGRTRDVRDERTVSPQRLVFYRDNWHLDGWCHWRKELRTFSLDRILTCNLNSEQAQDIPEQELETHYAQAYGLFAGRPKDTAVIRFSAHAARWVAEEQWHPQQQGQQLDNGGYELHIPYSDSRELIRDVLGFGPEAEIIAPESHSQTAPTSPATSTLSVAFCYGLMVL